MVKSTLSTILVLRLCLAVAARRGESSSCSGSGSGSSSDSGSARSRSCSRSRSGSGSLAIIVFALRMVTRFPLEKNGHCVKKPWVKICLLTFGTTSCCCFKNSFGRAFNLSIWAVIKTLVSRLILGMMVPFYIGIIIRRFKDSYQAL